MRRLLVVLPLLLLVACTGGQRFGPLRLDVPEGWRVTDRTTDRLQIADGTVAADTETEPGSAEAVFDVYLDSPQTFQSYRDTLRSLEVEWEERPLTLDGHDAMAFDARGQGVAGRREAVLIPAYRVLIVYRAAFPNDPAAFEAGYDAFQEAVASISFRRDPIASPA